MSDATSPTTPARPDDEVLRLRSQVSTLNSQNERLVRTLRDARSQIVTLKSEVDRLGQPPATYGVLLETFADGTADIMTAGRKMRVAVSPPARPVATHEPDAAPTMTSKSHARKSSKASSRRSTTSMR